MLQLKDLRVNQWIEPCIGVNTRELDRELCTGLSTLYTRSPGSMLLLLEPTLNNHVLYILYNIILSEPSTSFYCYLMTCDHYCDHVMWLVTVWLWYHAKTLTPVLRIEDKRNKNEKMKRKVKRNLGPNFVSLTQCFWYMLTLRTAHSL